MPDTDILERLKQLDNLLHWPASHYVYRPAIAEIESLRRELTAMRSKLEAAEGMLRDSAAMLNAAIRIVRPLDLNVKDVELWAGQVKVNMQALSNLDEARTTEKPNV